MSTRRLALLSLFLVGAVANADGPSWAKFASGNGSIAFLAIGTLLPLSREEGSGREHALRTADALFVSVSFSEGLKALTHVRRPDSTAHDSFPSGHATAAFAVATMESEFHPREAPLWYAGAAAIADSRVVLHRHRWSDVVAGAALGFGTAKWELSQRHGFLIRPWLSDGNSVGILVSSNF